MHHANEENSERTSKVCDYLPRKVECVVRDLREGPRLYSVREPTMNAILWKLTNRIKSGKILTLFTTSTTVKSGPVIWLLSTLE